MAAKQHGAYERFLRDRPRAEADYWRARLFIGFNYWKGREAAGLRAVKRAVARAGDDPWAFLRELEAAIERSWHRDPEARHADAERWCDNVNELCDNVDELTGTDSAAEARRLAAEGA